jgi:Trk-type K+ transport system membrane component
VTNLQLLHPAILVSYLVMMYISVFPIAMSIRNTNVYEEQSLGIYAADDEENASFLGISSEYLC